MCEAQLEDGYLDTYYILNDISKRFTNLRDNHELYCFGHLAEAGKRPYYFDREHPPKAEEAGQLRGQYHQSHLPVREQDEAVGHAVRAVYLYSGMADFARLTGDESLK